MANENLVLYCRLPAISEAVTYFLIFLALWAALVLGMELETRSSTADDAILTAYVNGADDFEYPSVPESWHVVRDDGMRSGPTASA